LQKDFNLVTISQFALKQSWIGYPIHHALLTAGSQSALKGSKVEYRCNVGKKQQQIQTNGHYVKELNSMPLVSSSLCNLRATFHPRER